MPIHLFDTFTPCFIEQAEDTDLNTHSYITGLCPFLVAPLVEYDG